MVCGSCGRETSRALQRCDHCGRDLHAASPIRGVCPGCRVSVRETQIACFNCGRILDPEAAREAPRDAESARPPLPAEATRRRKAMLRAVWPARIVGGLLTILGASRMYLSLEFFRFSELYEQEIAVLGYAAVWFVVALIGIGLFAFSFTLKPDY